MTNQSPLRVYVACPAECDPERQAVWAAVNQLSSRTNPLHLPPLVVADPVGGMRPGVGPDAQDVVLEATDLGDICVVIFWRTIGQPTKTEMSGTVQELRAHQQRESKTEIMVYFKQSSEGLDTSDTEALESMLHLARFQKELETQGFLIKRFQHTTDFERDIKEDLRDAAMKLSNTSPVVARGRRLFRASIRRRGTVDRPSSHGLAVPKPEGGSWLTASPRPGLTHLCATRAGEVQLLAVGYDDGLVRLEHGSTNRLANTYDYGGRRRSLKDLAGRSEGVSSRAKSFGHQVLTRRSRLLTSRVSSIEMSSSSCQLFVTRGDGTITKVDMTSVADPVEDLIGKLTSLPLATHWCEVEPHGGELLVGCEDGLVFAWNIETLECKKSSSLSLAGEPASPVDASLNHMVIGELDGSITIAASTDDKLITWGVGREPRERVVDSPITALELVQVVGRKGLIVFGDASGDITAVYASGTRMKTEHDALSQGPRDTLEAGDGTSGRPAAITALAGFAERAGAYVAVGGRDGTVRVWDAKAAHFVRGWRIRESSRIGAIAWCRSDDELELWIAQRDGRVTSRELSYSETWQAAR